MIEIGRTNTVYKTLNPIWKDQLFDINIPSRMNYKNQNITYYDSNDDTNNANENDLKLIEMLMNEEWNSITLYIEVWDIDDEKKVRSLICLYVYIFYMFYKYKSDIFNKKKKKKLLILNIYTINREIF